MHCHSPSGFCRQVEQAPCTTAPSFGLVLGCLSLSPRGVFEQGRIDSARGEVDVADDGAANEHIFGGALSQAQGQRAIRHGRHAGSPTR